MFCRDKPREYDDDNGETIANMNVEGMPWYRPPRPEGEEEPRITRREAAAMALNAVLAGLAVALVFIIAGAAFLLFCTDIWLR